jgi:hypothetical protein
MGQSTISMAIFNSYASLPEGNKCSKAPTSWWYVDPLELKNIVAPWCPFLLRFSPSSRYLPSQISIYIQPKRIFGDIWLTNQQQI